MSSWIRYVPLDDHPFYVNEGSMHEEHKSFWELPAEVNTEDVQEVRVAGDWSVEWTSYSCIVFYC